MKKKFTHSILLPFTLFSFLVLFNSQAQAQTYCSASFTFQVVPNSLTVNFTDASPSSNQWSWYFGDGNTSTMQNPIHTYANVGTYVVCLAVQGCVDTICLSVSVGAPPCNLVVNAGPDQGWVGKNGSAKTFTLAGSAVPSGATGQWTKISGPSGGTFSNAGSNVSTFTCAVGNSSNYIYSLRWSVTDPNCPAPVYDDVQLKFYNTQSLPPCEMGTLRVGNNVNKVYMHTHLANGVCTDEIQANINPGTNAGPQMAAKLLQGYHLGRCIGGVATEFPRPSCKWEGSEMEEVISNSLNVSPNPFSSSTTFSFSSENDASVTLKIYDLNGKLIVMPFTGEVLAGEMYYAKFNTDDNLANGIYFARLESTSGEMLTKKIIITK